MPKGKNNMKKPTGQANVRPVGKQSPRQEKPQSDEDKSKLSPEQEELLDLFIINGMNIIYDEKFSKSLLGKIQSAGDPVRATAEALADIVLRLKKSARENGAEMSDSIVANGANVLLAELLKVLEAAGMKSFTKEQKIACFQFAVSFYFDKAVKTGDMTKEELIQKAREAGQTKQGKKVFETAKQKKFNLSQGGV